MALEIEKYEPLGPFVLLKNIGEELEKTPGGIHLPDIAKSKSQKGRVIAVGDGILVGGQLHKAKVEKNDVVLYSKYGGTEVKLDGEDFVLVRMDELYLRERSVTLVSQV